MKFQSIDAMKRLSFASVDASGEKTTEPTQPSVPRRDYTMRNTELP